MKSHFLLSLNLIILVLYVQFPVSSSSQVLSKFGIKGGLILSGVNSTDERIVPSDNTFFVNYLNFDVGGYTELFSTKNFCISTEIHYELKGQQNPNFTKIVLEETVGGEKIYTSKYMNDRFHYLSFQILPRYRFEINSSGENIYVIGGPVFDLLLSNSHSSDLTNTLNLNNYKVDIGAVTGIGIELMNWLILELRFEHNFTGPYKFVYGNETGLKLLDSFYFLTGISINKLKL